MTVLAPPQAPATAGLSPIEEIVAEARAGRPFARQFSRPSWFPSSEFGGVPRLRPGPGRGGRLASPARYHPDP